MCDAITMLDGRPVESVGCLRESVPDGDLSLLSDRDGDCLCHVDLPAYLASSSLRFKRETCILSSIFSTWSQVDDEGRTFSDSVDYVDETKSSDIIDFVQIVRRDDWPYGFVGLDESLKRYRKV